MGEKIKSKLSAWITGDGPDSDIVLSSRIRLARNLENLPYPNHANQEEKQKVLEQIKEAISVWDKLKLNFIQLDELAEVEKKVLVERHLISPNHAQAGSENAVLLNEEETISVMINEEDHLRIQVLSPGLQLKNIWDIANNLDDNLEKNLDYAFSQKWGYLSSCPTNVGTGLRASVMVHLPALNLTGNVNKTVTAISQLGLVVRGLYGEGSESTASIYQISNQITLGHSETDIIENLKSVSKQVIEQERQARKIILKENSVTVKDAIKRAYGVLKYAYTISSEEAMKLLSSVKLGVDMGIIEDVEKGVLRELIVLNRPAHLQRLEGQELSIEQRDIKRAELIQNRLLSK